MSAFHGLILVDKPVGWTSHDVVAKARRILQTKKIGHAGTLDPLASGLLILLVGHATKLSDFLLNGKKSYQVVALLGVETDTLDMTGEVLRECVVNTDEKTVEKAVVDLQGELELPVPKYSAVKVNGRRLYKYAQKNIEVEDVYRTSTFQEVKFLGFQDEQIIASLTCSKGAFVRAWVSELGRRLDCGAAVKELRRTESSPYSVNLAVSLERLEEIVQADGFANCSAIIPMEATLPQWHLVEASLEDEQLLLNGVLSQGLKAQILQGLRDGWADCPGVKVVSCADSSLLALLEPAQDGFCKIRRVFPRDGQ